VTFAELLASANQSKTGHNLDQWTPAAVEPWRAAPPEMARLLDAAFALEFKLDRRVTPGASVPTCMDETQ
jgi:hypothetical protein